MFPLRGVAPIDRKVATRATGMPRRASESRIESAAGVNAVRELMDTSPPSSAFDCSRIERSTLPANESIATSAATPSEIDDM